MKLNILEVLDNFFKPPPEVPKSEHVQYKLLGVVSIFFLIALFAGFVSTMFWIYQWLK